MGAGPFDKALQPLRQLAASEMFADCPDGELLARFLSQRDQTAFAELVRRHRRLVGGLCRHLLRHDQDAEDAFQATFLVLVLKGRSIRKTPSLACWLHGVAYRCAMQIKRQEARRQRREQAAARDRSRTTGNDAGARELAEIVQAEVQRLPATHRAAFVLCCLEGKSQEEAARALGWKIGTLSGRLARARQEIQRRLARRGIAVPAAFAAVALGAAEVSAAASAATLHAGVAALGGAVSPNVLAIVKGVTQAMLVTKLKSALIVVTLAGLMAGIGVAAQQAFIHNPDAPPHPVAVAGQAKEPAKPAPEPARNENLRYDGKPFESWRDYATNELKPERRVEAIRAMGAFGVRGHAKEAVQVVVDLMKEYSDRDIITADSVEKSKATPDQLVIQEAFGTAAKIGPAGVPVFLKDLSTPNLRVFAVAAIRGKIGLPDSEVPALTALVVNGARDIRNCALEILGVANMDDASAERRAELFWAAAKKDPKKAVRALADVVAQDPAAIYDGYARRWAAYLLGRLGEAAHDAGPALAKAALEKQPPSVFETINDAMSRTKTDPQVILPLAIKALEAKMEGDDFTPTDAALHVLWELGAAAKPAVPALIGAIPPYTEAAGQGTKRHAQRMSMILGMLEKLGAAKEQIVPAVSGILESNEYDWESQAAAFRLLRKTDADLEPLVPVLANYLERRKSAPNAHEALLVFQGLGPKAKKAMPSLLRMFKEKLGPDIRMDIIKTWTKMGSAAHDALPELYPIVADKSNSAEHAVKLRDAANEAIKAMSK